jgi:hypothetical protein
MGVPDRNEEDAIRDAVEWIREHVELRESSRSRAERQRPREHQQGQYV